MPEASSLWMHHATKTCIFFLVLEVEDNNSPFDASNNTKEASICWLEVARRREKKVEQGRRGGGGEQGIFSSIIQWILNGTFYVEI